MLQIYGKLDKSSRRKRYIHSYRYSVELRTLPFLNQVCGCFGNIQFGRSSLTLPVVQ